MRERPGFAGKGQPVARVMEHDPLYASVADVIVDTDGLTPDQIIDQVLARVA